MEKIYLVDEDLRADERYKTVKPSDIILQDTGFEVDCC